MSDSDGLQTARSPIALGCTFLAVVAVLAVGVVVFFVTFLDSGANRGEAVLEPAAGYAEGSVQYLGERNFYLVRLPGGDFVALRDLDRANQASSGARCRVALASVREAESGTSVDLEARMSPQARGASVVLRETCLGAIYDIAGVRLDDVGRNLDRYAVTINDRGRVVVHTSERTCSRRTDSDYIEPTQC